MRSFIHPLFSVAFLLLATVVSPQRSPDSPLPCSSCAVWNTPQEPFKIYGNTFYVGPHGLTSLLITSPRGHILIDGALPESAPQIVANIRALGFRIEDVKLILNSHVHFDHAGGIAELQRLSGAEVAAGPWSANVLTSSGIGKGDPQLGILRPIPLVPRARILKDGKTLKVHRLAVTAHFTPGHTPGGTSFTWQSCENNLCLNMVYADSVTAVSADDFQFSASSRYPNALQDFARTFAFLRSTPCDVLLTPHPEASGLWDHLEERKRGVQANPMRVPGACKDLADGAQEQLRQRLASEQPYK